MTQPVVHVDIDAPIDVCIRVLNEAGVRRVLVRDPAKVTSGQPLAAFVGMVGWQWRGVLQIGETGPNAWAVAA